jgi:hypothetical protein
VQPIDRVGGKGHGRIESKTVGGADDVVVDGLRHADDGNTELAELMCDRQRAVTTDRDQRVQLHPVKHLDDACAVSALAVGGVDQRIERIAVVEGTEDRAAEPQNAGDLTRRENARPSHLEQAVETIFEPQALDAVVGGRFDDGTNDGVQTGRIAAAGQNAKTFDGLHGLGL